MADDLLDRNGGLPEAFVTDDHAHIRAPTYEAVAQCYMMMTSAETGQTGPTLVEPGEIFTTEMTPNDQWRPLNRAAEERLYAWRDSLPQKGEKIPEEYINQAAMELRPREGDPEFPHATWYQHVLKLAATKYGQVRGRMHVPGVRGAMPYRPGGMASPIMSNASSGPVTPIEPGRPMGNVAEHQPQNPAMVAQRARRGRVAPAMPNTLPGETPQQAQG